MVNLCQIANGAKVLDCGGSAESQDLGGEFGGGQIYDAQQLNEEEGHSQDPDNVTVVIVEGLASELDSVPGGSGATVSLRQIANGAKEFPHNRKHR